MMSVCASPPEEAHLGTHPGSRAICGCGVFLGRSGSQGSRCTPPVQSYQCTAAHRATLHTCPRLQAEGAHDPRLLYFAFVGNIDHYKEGVMQEDQQKQLPCLTWGVLSKHFCK